MTNQPEIAPCPFCGGECYVAAESMIATLYRVCCVDCGYRSPGFGADDTAVAEHSRIATAIPVERVREVASTVRHQAMVDMCSPGWAAAEIMRRLGIDLREDTSAARAAKGGG